MDLYIFYKFAVVGINYIFRQHIIIQKNVLHISFKMLFSLDYYFSMFIMINEVCSFSTVRYCYLLWTKIHKTDTLEFTL